MPVLAGSAALAALPYRLTGAQQQALAEIAGDMAGESRMLRLLQGDVGSGKTVVALLAMATAVEAGCQAALMAPTEILARQHLQTITPLAEAAGLTVGLLTGRNKGKSRAAVLEGLASGATDIAVGTHALFQEDVAFHNLGLAVIDEQHRFGDLEVSKLTEKPPGRQPVDTRALPLERLEEVIAAVGRAIERDAKVYWVCPLVAESESVDLAAAEDRHAALKRIFGERVGLIHGRMAGRDKDAVMAAFAEGPLAILVATTVIEVGVDVPQASVMVIEHAERFGLAQLHQLRGRIGRGQARSTCLLCYQSPLGEVAKARIQILRETEDGFRIAEEDLKLRGAGELLGTRQSGLPVFRLADLQAHGDLLAIARDDARLALERDPELKSERGQALRTLLYLFERDAAVAYLRSG